MTQYNKKWYSENRERIRATAKIWQQNNKDKIRESYIRCKLAKPENYLLRQAKKRAKDKNLEITITKEHIKIPKVCPIMGVKLEYVPFGYSDYSPSIDRIDSSKGYTPDNIQVISSIANRMKWTATREQLVQFAKGILALEKGD